MKIHSWILIVVVIQINLLQYEGVECKPFPQPSFFSKLFESMGLKRRNYYRGTYIPPNGQEMPKKPKGLFSSDSSSSGSKTLTSGLGALAKQCPEGTQMSFSGKCIAMYDFDFDFK